MSLSLDQSENVERLAPDSHEVGESTVLARKVSALGSVMMLAKREWVRFFRQRNRVIGALVQPILFWLLFGTGMHSAFRGGDQDFMTYYLPGTLTLIVLFTAIFTTISVIEDRKEGFLQNVLVAPVPRWTIVAGKVIGGGVIAWAQSLIFLLLLLCIGKVALSLSLLGCVLLLGLASMALTSLGLFFAWPMESTQGFHAIMSVVLMPMWLLSGAFFPIPLGEDAAVGQAIMHWIMRLNPLSYIVGGLRGMLSATADTSGMWLPSLGVNWMVSALFLVTTFGAAWWMVLRPAKGDLK